MKKSSVITSRSGEKYKIFLLYTLLFCVFVVGIFAVLIISHRSVMQFHDAYKQGAFRLVEFRNQLHNILSGAGFSFWSWYEGTGLDEPLENFMDPCSLIGSLFPIRYLELGFTFAALLRMYLGGLAFIVLGREVELEDRKVLLGAVLYAFSACFMGLALRQSESLINAYLFPILVASVDRIYKGKNPALFILSVAYYMLLAIYYAYMSAIAIVMYILIRYFAYNDEFRISEWLATIGKFIGFGIVGIMISACSSVFSAFTIMRASTDSTVGSYGLLFDSDWYTTFGKMLLGTGATSDYSDIGPYILILMLMPVAIRYISKKSTATIMTMILFVMVLIPVFCSMFNGFGYPTPRWSYTLLLFMEWCGIEQFEAERFRDRKNLMLAGLGLIIISVWTFGFFKLGIIDISRTGRIYVPLQLAAGAVLFALLAVISRQGRISKRIYAAFFLIPLVSLSLGWARGFSNNIEDFARNSSVYNNLQESALRAGPEIEDEGFYRIDSVDAISRHAVIKFPSNENIWWKTNNLIIYNSRIPKTLTDFNVELGNSYGYARRVFMVSNGNRVGLDFLYGVRYFLGSDAKDPEGTRDSDNYADYGFEKTGEIDGVNVFRNKYDAGLGFVLPEAMTQTEFEKLGRLAMEQAMLQAAVIPDDQKDKTGNAPMVKAEDIDIEIEDIPFEVTSTDGCTVEDGRIIADKSDASFTISVKDVPESQMVISFDDLLLNSKDGIDGDSYEIFAEDGRVLKHVIRQNSRQGVAGLKNHDINMGHFQGDDDIRITLTSKGTYTFEKLYVSAMSLSNYDRYASKCMENRLNVTDYSDRKVEGRVSTDEGGILFLSIPAYDNWDVYVDGGKADKISGLDTTFCGVYVGAGEHSIVLRYNNPYVRYGSIVSVLGLLILAIILIKRRRNRRAFRSSSSVISLLLGLSLLVLTFTAGRPQTAAATDWLSGQEDALVAVRINDGCIRISEILEKEFFPWASVHHIYPHGHTGRDDEHSFEAYDADIEAGAHFVEPDLVISRDGTLYVSHDLSAARMTGVNRNYSSMSDSEIDKLRSRGGSRILKLSEVFERYGDSVYYLPELKTSDAEMMEAFRALVEEYGLEDRVTLQSEFPSVLEKAEAIWPEMPKIQIVKSQEVFNDCLGSGYVDEAAVRINLLNEANCSAAHGSGKRISAWPVDTGRDIRMAIDLGADAYFTGNVEQAVDLELNYRRNPFGPLDTIVFASDYQEERGFPEPSETLAALIRSAEESGRHINAAVICGDFSNDAKKHDYQISPDDAIAEAKATISTEAPLTGEDKMIFVQGNHDRMTDQISESGLHEYENYLVYVLNTENDFPWKQGKTAGARDKVNAAAARMKICFDELIKADETRPVFIAGHVPLHYTARDSSRHTTGDNIYSSLIFDAVNEASEELDIIYMYGHDHSKGWDCYLGGACVYKAPGDTMLLPVPHEGAVTTDEFEEKELGFTYLNAGYTGYYMNCAPEEYSSEPDSEYRAADEKLTCTICEVYKNRVEIMRYDSDGMHVLGAAGEADPYKGGIDKDLIPSDRYSQITDGPVLLKRHDKAREGLRDAA